MSVFDDLGLGVEIKPLDRSQFLKVKETLTRMGLGKDRTLFQSCHILHKRGCYAIMHFKEMLALDGCRVDFTSEDILRRNTIARLLTQWFDFVQILHPEVVAAAFEPPFKERLRVIHYDEKDEWSLVPQYVVGKKA